MSAKESVYLLVEGDMPGFKELYDKAVVAKRETFLFKGREILVSYAKYVLEYYNSLKKNT